MSVQRLTYQNKVLTQRCTIRRAEPGTPSPYGGLTERDQTVQTGVPCRCQKPRQPRQVETGRRGVQVADWEVLLPAGTQVHPADEIALDGQTYEVQGSDAGRGNALKLIAYCTRREN